MTEFTINDEKYVLEEIKEFRYSLNAQFDNFLADLKPEQREIFLNSAYYNFIKDGLKSLKCLDSKESKIKAKKITFTWGEGSHYPFPVSFTNWDDANNFLYSRSKEAENYLKTDFEIEFEDGNTYRGCYDIHNREMERADLGAHIMSRALLDSGRKFPARTTKEQAEDYLSYIPEEARKGFERLIDNYEIEFFECNLFQC